MHQKSSQSLYLHRTLRQEIRVYLTYAYLLPFPIFLRLILLFQLVLPIILY